LVVADGNWTAVAVGGTCAVTLGSSSATGQVITVDVTGACAVGNTITVTYKGMAPATAQVGTVVITTDDAALGSPALPIAAPHTITVVAVASVTPTASGGRSGSSRVTGGTGIALSIPVNGVPTVTADGQVLCPNGMTAASNCTILPVLGPGLCPNGMTIGSNCLLPPTLSNPVGPFGYAFGVVTVKRGSSGAACLAWQSFFNNKRNAGLVLDGKCGPLTMAAAVAWQAASGLVADGLLGPKSRAQANIQAATGATASLPSLPTTGFGPITPSTTTTGSPTY
jgi:hypothetical protein